MPLAFEFECTPDHQYCAHVSIIGTKAGSEKGRTLHGNSQSVLATPRGTSASRSRALHDLYYTMNSAADTSTPRLWHLERHVEDEDERRTASKKEVCTCRFSKATSFRTLFSSSALALMVPTPSDAMTSSAERFISRNREQQAAASVFSRRFSAGRGSLSGYRTGLHQHPQLLLHPHRTRLLSPSRA